MLELTFGGKRSHRRMGNTFTFDLAKLGWVGESFNLKNRIETRVITGNGEDVKAVKALGIGYGDNNGNNREVSREKNDLNKEEKQTKLPIPPWKKNMLDRDLVFFTPFVKVTLVWRNSYINPRTFWSSGTLISDTYFPI
jgi:hypothetical protein